MARLGFNYKGLDPIGLIVSCAQHMELWGGVCCAVWHIVEGCPDGSFFWLGFVGQVRLGDDDAVLLLPLTGDETLCDGLSEIHAGCCSRPFFRACPFF